VIKPLAQKLLTFVYKVNWHEDVGGGGDNCSSKTRKAPDKSPHWQANDQLFYRPDALSVAQPTVSNHWRGSRECIVIILYWVRSTEFSTGTVNVISHFICCINVFVYVGAEYGGKWKMLHYFAKKFFHATILSAYIANGSVSLYYINDDVYRQTREFDSTQMKQPGSSRRLSDGSQLMVDESRVNTSRHWFNRLYQMSRSDFSDASPPVVGDGTVSFQQTLNNLNHHQSSSSSVKRDNCTVLLQCFTWTSFASTAQWNITFPRVCKLILLQTYTPFGRPFSR